MISPSRSQVASLRLGLAHVLELRDRLQHLPYLVRLRLALRILDVHAGIPWPGHLVDMVTRPVLPRLTEEMVANLDEVAEVDLPAGIYVRDDLADGPAGHAL